MRYLFVFVESFVYCSGTFPASQWGFCISMVCLFHFLLPYEGGVFDSVSSLMTYHALGFLCRYHYLTNLKMEILLSSETFLDAQ
jgi:hypothetical protein